MLTQISNDLTVAKHTHRNHNKANAVGQLRDIEAITCHAGVDVSTDQAEQQAQQNHAHGFE